MPQSLTNFDNALKDFYGPGLKEAVNNSNPVLTEATRNDEDIQGRRAVWSVHTGRSTSTSARAELGTLASADRQRFSQMNEDLAFLYHTVKVSGPAKHLTKGDNGAFARALETELDGAETDLKNDISRQVFGQSLTDGTNLQTGVLTTLAADPGTGTTWTVTNMTASEFRFLFVGMTFNIINPSGGAARAGGPFTIATLNPSAKTFTTAEAANGAEASGDYMVRASGATAATSNFGSEINGLRHLINSTSVFAGVNPSTVPSWAAVTAGSSTTQISETLLDLAAEAVETDGNGDSPSLYIAEHSQRRKLAQQLQSQKMYEGRELTLTAGWRGLQIARGTLVTDRYCPVNDIFAITPKYLVRFVGLDWTWDDDDGKVLFKALDGADAVEARFKTYMNLVTTVRNAHARITVSTPSFT